MTRPWVKRYAVNTVQYFELKALVLLSFEHGAVALG